MQLIPRIRTLLLIAILAAAASPSPVFASAQATEFDGIPFENPSAIAAATAPAPSPEAGATPEAASGEHGAYLGDPEAPVTMQLYADYQCPHCRSFHDSVEPLLIEDYVRPGRIRLELIDFPVIGIGSPDELTDDSKESVQAAEATMCAGEQDAYMEYREALYDGDLTPNSGALSDDNLVAIAGDLGLDGESLATCLAEGRYEQAIIDGHREGMDKGVRGTPTMMIDGEILQPSTYSELQEMLDTAIDAAE